MRHAGSIKRHHPLICEATLNLRIAATSERRLQAVGEAAAAAASKRVREVLQKHIGEKE